MDLRNPPIARLYQQFLLAGVHCESPLWAQGCPDPATRYGSAYWGRPATHWRAREVVGVAEYDPYVWSGRASQEVSSIWMGAVLEALPIARFPSPLIEPDVP